MEELPIVVYSHLRWDSVFQRPHHLLSRLARRRLVLFVEEPVASPEGVPDSWEIQFVAPTLRVCRPVVEGGAAFDGCALPHMLELLLGWHEVRRHVAWLYSPMAHQLAMAQEPELVVYDCMDELSAFLGAPAALRLHETALLRDADLVFTGGPSLFRAKRVLHPTVRCFPSSVDADHFRPAREAGPVADDLAEIPGPRIGFCGVLDERLDRELLEGVAAARPDWQFVLVGPVAKIDPASLPQRPNIHYLGQRPYLDLPEYLRGFDVCMMPFARNEATRFISPTKTLEYMAAGKPIVSTRIRDVVDPYGEIVYTGDSADEFVRACERALHTPARERAGRDARVEDVLRRTSWASTVEAMRKEIRIASRRVPSRVPIPVGFTGGLESREAS